VRRYAQDTTVSVGRSRAEVDDLLRAWGCERIGWADDYRVGRVELHFQWLRDDQTYLARFVLQLPDETQLRAVARDGRNGAFSPAKFERLRQGAGRHEHRVLLLWLKAALNAVEAGIIDPAVIFLPFLVGRDGRTFGDVAIARLPEILIHDASRLLPEARS